MNGFKGGSVKGRLFLGQPPLMRIGGLFLTRTASFTLALHWEASFPLRFLIQWIREK